MVIETLSRAQLEDKARAEVPENAGTEGEEFVQQVLALYDRASARGDGVAVYENADLGHPDIGEKQWVTYGGPEAQLELREDADDPASLPPATLPDIGGRINWRYRLIAVARRGLTEGLDLVPTPTHTAYCKECGVSLEAHDVGRPSHSFAR